MAPFKDVDVIHHANRTKRYRIIKAQAPASWRQSNGISDTGYQTIVGFASFREVLSNKLDPNQLVEAGVRMGRPKKPGRPWKSATRKTIEKLKKSLHRHRSGGGAGEATDEKGDDEDKKNPISKVVTVVDRGYKNGVEVVELIINGSIGDAAENVLIYRGDVAVLDGLAEMTGRGMVNEWFLVSRSQPGWEGLASPGRYPEAPDASFKRPEVWGAMPVNG
ncbi:hypothetical protein DFH09DRAFT_1104567 [Mycena vulgaris]|nr:hypothetical protein DFH09DRAFT_1104567 [Mycena vulgaris]